tara:strand:- start:8886 stop:10052 length:1167 start_codon:yes stop_codon:yes gene_type:complete
MEDNKVPNDFKKIINEFCGDLLTSFPEETDSSIKLLYNGNEFDYEKIFEHCKKIYPERFFDILYQNEEIFDNEEYDLTFLPDIDFKILWKLEDVSDNIKETIWKYLQLILFATVGNINDGKSFGDTAKLFETINETDFKDKLKETMENIQSTFESKESDISNNINDTMPNIDGFQEHLSSMLEGKIGQLAKEIAEETAEEMAKELGDVENTDDVLKAMMKNPTKIMGLVKKAGSKLDEKIKSGEIKKSELMEEAGELMKKVEGMPGMGNINKILKQMGVDGMPGMPNMGRKAKFNTGAFKSHMEREMKREKIVERLKKQTEENKIKEAQSKINQVELAKKEEEYNKWVDEGGMDEFLFSLGEKPEKSSRDQNPNKQNKPKKKKKKGKK